MAATIEVADTIYGVTMSDAAVSAIVSLRLADIPAEVVLYTISMDLPFALERWRGAESAGHALLSAHRDEAFGRDYGTLIKEWRLLQRAVFVIDGDGRIAYADYVADQMQDRVLVHVGRAKARRATDPAARAGATFRWTLAALIVVVSSIPWPGFFVERPLFRVD